MHLFEPEKLLNLVYAISLFFIGYFVAKQISFLVARGLGKHFSAHHSMLVKRILFYLIFTIFAVSSLQNLGVKLSVLLGAAGVFTVAISFASQTAASNLISGIFLLFEQPFKVGDSVEIKGISGTVDSIDLLSTKLKTPDNKLVRIPNEVMIKTEITNLSYFSTRRIDLIVSVAYDCDINRVKSMLMNIAGDCDQILKEPAPYASIDNFANSAMEIKFMVWVNTADLTAARNLLQERIKQQFDQEGIEAPPPQITVHRV
ncbi:mechanosensitive ion channel family protein [Legionella jordanis]|uniref:Small-conductance mechanosensitive channel n=1 Tax=Legionella jordanis TaxID=456 RepID=A0A0W0V9N2_9GAMM|nr:mechanosensitive ion channel family protein [Legionella jordanis]KTD16802.1 mechanosensitive ion channel MscS [Legionella jordanis]RMX03673.1 mechanosensitive ion channel family protein [Legionella jordanis]RMX22266.1 mechanosensitive ion channel family protein [Legionella jordanis]VEH11731.1 mechanosensitive ion channel MscS [Legionella jordanis]HAT8712957.1 mechanosensitive ion channel [Legionella jordanis]